MRGKILGLLAIAAMFVPAAAPAQDAEVGFRVLEVGQEAPDFQLTGATRFGVSRSSSRAMRDPRSAGSTAPTETSATAGSSTTVHFSSSMQSAVSRGGRSRSEKSTPRRTKNWRGRSIESHHQTRGTTRTLNAEDLRLDGCAFAATF